MRKIIILLIAMMLTVVTFSQSPDAFTYQAVLRDASGAIKANSNVSVQISILQGSASGSSVYTETFAVTTNSYGLININVGKGTVVSGNFTSIVWATGPYFIKISLDGADYGTSQLLSVPYAKYADKAGNGFSGSYNDLTGKPTVFSGNYNDLSNKPTILDASKYSTATGFQSLFSNTTGFSNTANGYKTLYSNTTGYRNTANGDSVLYRNTTGYENTANGFFTLFSNTTGYSNTATGTGALGFNTSGRYNTATGWGALYYNQVGYYNVADGAGALYWNTGGYNTACGDNALYANTTGSYNTAFGNGALNINTTGSYNTALGYNANVAAGLTNSTAIGNGASVDVSNKIVLGNASAQTVGGYGAWSNWSDRRLKENIVYTNKLGLNFITRLKPVSYNYIKDTNKRRRDGLIAQDVEQTLKELGLEFSGLIIDDNKDKTMNLSYAEFVIPMITAMQELNQKNKALESTLSEMKAEIEKLKQSPQNK